MIVISQKQMNVFSENFANSFEDEMFEHSIGFMPELSKILGEESLRYIVRQSIAHAKEYGFTKKGTIRIFIESIFLRGNGFDTDPQYPLLGKILSLPEDEMQRAEKIHKECLSYYENVSGYKSKNLLRALEKLLSILEKPFEYSSEHFEADILREMRNTFPQKITYIGEKNILLLIHEGRLISDKYELPEITGEALIIGLMFTFGHNCFNDPSYPWINRVLTDEKIITPEKRAERLKKKATTWLKKVLSRNA